MERRSWSTYAPSNPSPCASAPPTSWPECALTYPHACSLRPWAHAPPCLCTCGSPLRPFGRLRPVRRGLRAARVASPGPPRLVRPLCLPGPADASALGFPCESFLLRVGVAPPFLGLGHCASTRSASGLRLATLTRLPVTPGPCLGTQSDFTPGGFSERRDRRGLEVDRPPSTLPSDRERLRDGLTIQRIDLFELSPSPPSPCGLVTSFTVSSCQNLMRDLKNI